MLMLLPVLLENITFYGSRTLCDILFIISVIVLVIKKERIKSDVMSLSIFVVTFIVMTHNLLFNYQNVSAEINNEIFNSMQWLISDRGIADFVPLGDTYRNTLIYLRYLLIPLYFSLGYFLSKKHGKEKSINSLWIMLFAALVSNLIFGLVKGDVRIAGLFDNTAALSSLALLTILIAYYTHSPIKIAFSSVIGIVTLVLSQTASAFLGLLIIALAILFRVKFPHRKSIFITVIASIIVSAVGLLPGMMNFIAAYMYTGSLANRLFVWSTIFSYYDSWNVFFFGLGAFPVFSDNVFIWLISGFGVFSLFIYAYFYKLGNLTRESSLFITVILWQGLLFPGFIMPYMVMTTFIILGILSTRDLKENGEIYARHIYN